MSDSGDDQEKKSLFSQMIGSTRYVMGLAVFGIFIGSTVLLITGTLDMLAAVWSRIIGDPAGYEVQLRVVLIEAVDTVLVATVLYVIAIGLYQLFIDRSLALPAWLQTHGVSDLEQRLAGMVVTVLGVIFLTAALESHGTRDITGFGLSIASVIAAIALFLYVEAKHSENHSDGDDH